MWKLNHWSMVSKSLKEFLRKVVELDEMQMGFVPRKDTIHAIFIMRQMMEKYETAGRKLYMVLVDLEKASDHVPREVILWAFRKGVGKGK